MKILFDFCISEPNAAMFVNTKIAKPSIFDVTKQTWSNEEFVGWVSNTNSNFND